MKAAGALCFTEHYIYILADPIPVWTLTMLRMRAIALCAHIDYTPIL